MFSLLNFNKIIYYILFNHYLLIELVPSGTLGDEETHKHITLLLE